MPKDTERLSDFGSAAPALIGLLLNPITDIQLERVTVAYSATVGFRKNPIHFPHG